jgi:hypothetical protein
MRRRDYLLSVKPKRRRRNVRNLPAIRRGEIERHARYVGAADTEDFWRWLVAWCWHNGQNGRDPTGALKLAAKRMGGDLTEADAETILERAHAMRQHRTADRLARFLGVTDRQRTAAGITTIGSIDVDRKQRNRRRRERQRMNRERRRRARGARPRAEYLEANSLTRTKPWEAKGISRRTWYRRRGTSPPTAMSPLKGGDPNGTSPPTAIFLSAEDTPVPPERKQGDFRGGAWGKEHGGPSPTSLVLKVGVPDGCAVGEAYVPEASSSGPPRPAWDAAAARAAAEAYVPPSALEDPTPAPPWVPYAQRDIDHPRHSREGLMVYVADVIETQLRNLDEAKEAIETARETVPETMQPAADATTLHEMPADLSEQQRQDAKRYFARWGDHARACGWTAAQQDRLIRQIKGREVKQLTDTQALVGNKVFYRSQLGM